MRLDLFEMNHERRLFNNSHIFLVHFLSMELNESEFQMAHSFHTVITCFHQRTDFEHFVLIVTVFHHELRKGHFPGLFLISIICFFSSSLSLVHWELKVFELPDRFYFLHQSSTLIKGSRKHSAEIRRRSWDPLVVMCLVEREAPNLGTSRELSKTRIIFKSSDLSIRRLHNASLFFETGNCLEVYSIMLKSDEFTVVELLHPNVSTLIDSVLRDITI